MARISFSFLVLFFFSL